MRFLPGVSGDLPENEGPGRRRRSDRDARRDEGATARVPAPPSAPELSGVVADSSSARRRMLARVSPPRWRLRVAAIVAALGLASLAAGGGFPAPDRPVPALISPGFSDQATRDRHGEADRALERLRGHPGPPGGEHGAGNGHLPRE